jgi:hypothetical protein
LDTGKDDGKREDKEEIDLTNKEEVEKFRREFIGEPPKKEVYDKGRKHNEEVFQTLLNALNKSINSRWVLPKDKSYLKFFRFIIGEQKRNADVIATMSEDLSDWAYNLKQTIFNVVWEIELTKGLTQRDLGTVKQRMEKILESPAVKQLEKILSDNAEALNKRDETRQKILRDSVV